MVKDIIAFDHLVANIAKYKNHTLKFRCKPHHLYLLIDFDHFSSISVNFYILSRLGTFSSPYNTRQFKYNRTNVISNLQLLIISYIDVCLNFDAFSFYIDSVSDSDDNDDDVLVACATK
ncbi:hypothetical protein BLOT_015022 [Blomia tropicalis]|nr:hypothetical protein BLOT_015022 [Blomia tropicalis]